MAVLRASSFLTTAWFMLIPDKLATAQIQQLVNDPSSPVLGRLMAKANHPAQPLHQNVDGWCWFPPTIGSATSTWWTWFYDKRMKHYEIMNRVAVSQEESAHNPGMLRSVLSHSFFTCAGDLWQLWFLLQCDKSTTMKLWKSTNDSKFLSKLTSWLPDAKTSATWI